MDRLNEYLGAVINIDGARYRLAGLDGSDALLADHPGGADVADPFVRMSIDDVAEAMVVQILRGTPTDHER